MLLKIQGPGDILLVDDDKDFHFIFERFYKKHSAIDNKLVSVYSGEQCLEYLVAIENDKEKKPALVLLDINMPGMLGFECVSKIREMPAYVQQPIVIMLSSSNYTRDIEKAFESGANDYLEKPNNLADLAFERVTPESI